MYQVKTARDGHIASIFQIPLIVGLLIRLAHFSDEVTCHVINGDGTGWWQVGDFHTGVNRAVLILAVGSVWVWNNIHQIKVLFTHFFVHNRSNISGIERIHRPCVVEGTASIERSICFLHMDFEGNIRWWHTVGHAVTGSHIRWDNPHCLTQKAAFFED